MSTCPRCYSDLRRTTLYRFASVAESESEVASAHGRPTRRALLGTVVWCPVHGLSWRKR